MKTVALVCYYLGPKLGIGQYLDQLLPPLIEELINRGFKVTLLCSPNAIEMTPAIQTLDEYVEALPILDASPGKRWLWLATQFRQFCHQQQIQSVLWLSNPIVLPWHVPSIAVIHDVNEWKSQEKYGSYFRTFLRSIIYLDASLLFAKQVVAVSKATEQDLVNFRPSQRLKSRLSVIANGMDTKLAHLPPVVQSKPSNPFLLSVGRIDPDAKRLPEAVKLVEAIRKESAEPWELHLVGGLNSSTQQSGQAFLDSIQLVPWIFFHGHISDAALAQWYRDSTAVVFLSDQEGFGLPIAEAFAFGRWSIVSTYNVAAAEAGGDAIISVDPKRPQQSANKLLGIIRNQQTPPIYGGFATWKDAAKQYTNEMSSLLSS